MWCVCVVCVVCVCGVCDVWCVCVVCKFTGVTLVVQGTAATLTASWMYLLRLRDLKSAVSVSLCCSVRVL